MSTTTVDLPLDLNGEDDTGLPWGYADEACEPDRVVAGAWLVVGSPRAQAVAQVTDVAPDGLVHVRPLPGPVTSHLDLITGAS